MLRILFYSKLSLKSKKKKLFSSTCSVKVLVDAYTNFYDDFDILLHILNVLMRILY